MLSSRKHGGIGAPYIDKYIIPVLREKCITTYQYLNKWNKKVCDLHFNRYIIDRVFPSFCRSVPAKFRQALQEFGHYYSAYKPSSYEKNYFVKDMESFKASYSPFIYFGEVSHPVFECLCDIRGFEMHMHFLVSEIRRWKPKIDCERATEIAQKRDLFLYRLFEFAQPVDITERAYRARRARGFAIAREVL